MDIEPGADEGQPTGPMTVTQGAEAFLAMDAQESHPEPETEEPATDPEDQADVELDASDDDDTPEVEEQTDSQTYAIKVQGKERDVTFDELVALAQKGDDYQLKTSTLAEERRALEKAQEEFKAKQQQQEALLGPLIERLQKDDFIDIDWAKLAQEDPMGYIEKKAAFDAQQQEKAKAQQELMQLAQAKQQEQAEMVQKHLTHQGELLKQMQPDFADGRKAHKAKADLVQFMKEHHKASDEDIGTITDARVMSAFYDQMKYRKLKANTAEAEKKSAKAPPVQKPGRSKPQNKKTAELDAAVNRLAKSGSRDDAAAAFMALGD